LEKLIKDNDQENLEKLWNFMEEELLPDYEEDEEDDDDDEDYDDDDDEDYEDDYE
jgi:hypothetical protein